ncbi:NAD(P)-dependent oxidoreductase [Candidatus Dojkabacteria bacterium]|uniref:NAD(P)-dependent oxidoreductase n=1 Tax=Candidatus Dojkabacteria bacterium TaxID=2099670 RepID=A0A955I8M5_9BACT|nr:NAD(P)-dependent oxidoreductase [Candidatus Dojkabacteria bacterium]
MNVVKKLHGSVRFPTSIIVKGANVLGVEIARSLLEQGGYVIIIDSESNASRKLLDPLVQYKNLTVLNYSAINTLGMDLRRLDYVFYFEHKSTHLREKISTQKYLQNSNYLDSMLDLCSKFDSKFLLTTSIKAHQLNISNAHVDYNYGLNSTSNHSQYMELEIQRYSESLVQEYIQRVGINARILRLGEIIGRGTEFDQNSSLIKLIRNGLEGKDLKVPGDGLEANYYIHYLDAAYGVLKAQFSASSKGRIFTLANPEEVTILSIAYKLLELLPTAREIRFDSEDDQFPSLILYKPAESLSTIGWKPRIEFDRSLIQTIEYIQELLIIEKALKEDSTLKVAQGKNMSDKIRDFFFVAENEGSEGDAISKLIAERKKLDMARTGNMIQANVGKKSATKPIVKQSFLQTIDTTLHDILFGFSRRIFFLKNVTVTDFIVTLFLITGFAVIYFMLISPLFSLSRNIFSTRVYYDRVIENVSNLNFEEARNNNLKLKNNLESAQLRVEDLQYLFSLLNKDDLYSSTQKYIESSIDYSEGYGNLLDAYTPMQSIIYNSNPNLVYRFGEDKLLSVNDTGNFKEELDQMYSQRGIIEDNLARVASAKEESNIYSQKLPTNLIQNISEKMLDLDEKFKSSQFIANQYNNLPLLMGREKPVNYLVVVQDNTRYSSSGGAIVGFINFTIEQGSIKSINTEVLRTPVFNKDVVTSDVLSSINLVSSKEVSTDNIVFQDLYNISEPTLFLNVIKRNYELNSKTNIDLVLSTNVGTLSRSMQNFGEINFRQLNFNDDNLLNNISLLNNTNDPIARNEIIMNLYAKNIADGFNNLNNNINDIVITMASSHDTKDMLYYTSNPEFESFIRSITGVSYSPNAELYFGMNHDPESKSDLTKYPISTISGSINIDAEYVTKSALNLRLNNVENLQNGYLCVSGGAQNIENIDVSPELVSTTYSVDKTCNIYLKDDDMSYGMNYTSSQFANPETKQTIFMLRLNKNPGIESNFDLEFAFDQNFEVTPEGTDFIKENNTFIYSGILTGDKIFKFELKK